MPRAKRHLRDYTAMKSAPFSGGAVTRYHKALLEFGEFSAAQNIRHEHPGIKKRKGQIKLHATADGTNTAVNLYQFRKRRIDEDWFFVQWSDGDVHYADTSPPGVDSGVFGTELYSGTAGNTAASWGNIDDIMIYSNGIDQHQTFTGDDNYVDGFFLFDHPSVNPDNMPATGDDLTQNVIDGLTTTHAPLDALNTYAAFENLFVNTPVAASKLTFTMVDGEVNDNASVMSVYYRKNDNTWAAVTGLSDGTDVSGDTLKQSGSVTWTPPTDEVPHYQYGISGYWYQIRVSAQLSATVSVSKLTYGRKTDGSGTSFQDIANVWDGVIPYAVECIHKDNSASVNKTYAAGSVILDDFEHTNDRLYFSSADPVVGVYIDVGATPNTATTATVSDVLYYNGTGFTSVGTISDGTNGFTNSGWITWPRVTAYPSNLNASQFHAYWYYIKTGVANLSSDVQVAMYTMPYFDIEELGKGQTNCVWKDRPILSATLWSNYIYVGAEGRPCSFNGNDYGILIAGDGRRNKIVAMRKFKNELMVWQEEKGVEGGTVTLFQGYSPATFGKLLISSKLGAMNNKSVAVVDGVLTSTRTDEKLKDLVFFLSRYGVCVSDGMTISIISDDINNYFDSTKSECIRRGYEDQMWLMHDTDYNVIRIGLVSGSSATTPNVFPVFDLVEKTWSFDSLGQSLSCAIEAEAGSGNVPVIHVGGGVGDGFVYLLNSGTDDVSTAIDSYVTMELNANGRYLQLDEMMVRCEAVASSAGDITVTLTKNDIAAGTKTLSMSPEVSGQTIRRHRFNLNICDQNISIKLQNATASKEMMLLDIGLLTRTFDDR